MRLKVPVAEYKKIFKRKEMINRKRFRMQVNVRCLGPDYRKFVGRHYMCQRCSFNVTICVHISVSGAVLYFCAVSLKLEHL